MKLFTEEDKALLTEKGISTRQVTEQIQTFQEGILPIHLGKAAVIGDGIEQLTPEEQQWLRKHYRSHAEGLKIVKFTPASGAASRMFKALFAFLETFDPGKQTLEDFLSE